MSKTNNTAARGNSRQSTERPSGRLVESFTVTLDACTARRLRFCAEEEGTTPEAFIACGAVQSLTASMGGGLNIDGEQFETEARVAKLNTRRAA